MKIDKLTPEQEKLFDVQFVEVKQDTILTHQEHKTVEVPEGMYELVHEREYNPFDEQVRRVLD